MTVLGNKIRAHPKILGLLYLIFPVEFMFEEFAFLVKLVLDIFFPPALN